MEAISGFLKINGLTLLLACILDWIMGDPVWLPHPVRLMGKMIGGLERSLRKRFGKREREAGTVLVLVMVFSWSLVPAAILGILWSLPLPGGILIPLLVRSALSAQLLAARDLKVQSCRVGESLKKGDLPEAKKRVSMIVGRDTAPLDEAGVARAAVETVAENTSDGVIAPMVFLALLGPAGGYFYKAVNTMDSMIGYRNEVYERFGKTAAHLDDLVNLIPARLTGFLFCLTAGLLPGFDGRGALRIFFRDRKKHASPNSAHGEAACAGALGLRLAGDAWYFGKLHHKPWIGDETRPIEAADIGRACRLMTGAQLLLLAGWGLMLWVL